MGNGAVKLQQTTEVLNCSICFGLFKVPRMLPCQHTFCEHCLHTYITKTMAHETEKVDFPCPVCRDPTTPPGAVKSRHKWARAFPKNRLIMKLFDEDPRKYEGCRLHPGKTIEFYCETHVDIGCSTCIMTRHKSCEKIPLESFMKGGKFKRSCQKNNDILLKYKKLFEDMVVDVGKNLDTLEEQKTSMLDSVKETTTTIHALLTRLETNIVKSINDKYQQECDSQLEQIGRCRKVIIDIGNTVEQVAAAQSDINMVQKAEIIVAVEERLSNFGANIREEHSNCKYTSINLTLDPIIEKVNAELEIFGNVNVEKSEFGRPLPPFVPKSLLREPPDVVRHKNKLVAKVGEFSLSGEDESFFCNITSTVVLADGRIILADDSNCKIKMMDGRFKLKAELKLESNPLNLAHVSETEVAVSIPGKREVAFIKIEPEALTIDRFIKTRLDCWGLDILDKTIAITTGRDGHSVILMDMQGKETNSFLLSTNADENIRCPVALTADTRNKLFYVTCTGGAWSKGCVVTMDTSGKIVDIFSDPDIDTPRSCMLDKHGQIYICGLESSTIHQMTVGGDVYKLFPTKTEHVVGPLHMNFIKNYHIRFLITEVACDIMKVYELPTSK